MTQDYKYDNALINYIQGIWDLKDLMENTKKLEGRIKEILKKIKLNFYKIQIKI